jgi:outer membrane protein OmpA-like peptidoglycan-associated protein
VLNGKHVKKPDISAGRRWGGRLALAATVAAVTAVVVVSLDGTEPATTLNPSRAAATVPVPAPVPTSAAPAPTTTLAPTTSTTQPERGPWFLPDGSVLPALLIYNGPTITLAGALPSKAALDRLRVLAKAYSLNPARIVSQVVIDPAIPNSVGLRVIEMDDGRFAEGSAVITPEYAPELARVVAAMKAMPNVTLLVVGHADQTGGGPQNVALSEARAESVVSYLISQGVNPGRMSARGVGDDDPLTTQSNAQGLALNRRTEFVFYGLFADPGQ